MTIKCCRQYQSDLKTMFSLQSELKIKPNCKGEDEVELCTKPELDCKNGKDQVLSIIDDEVICDDKKLKMSDRGEFEFSNS